MVASPVAHEMHHYRYARSPYSTCCPAPHPPLPLALVVGSVCKGHLGAPLSTTERRGEAYGVQLWLVISFSMFQSWQLGEKKAVSEWVASSEALAVRSTTRESLFDRLFEADGKRRSRKQPAGCETLLAGCDPLADPTAASRSALLYQRVL